MAVQFLRPVVQNVLLRRVTSFLLEAGVLTATEEVCRLDIQIHKSYEVKAANGTTLLNLQCCK